MIHDPALRHLLAPLARTVESITPEAELLKRLASKRPLRCKLGLDPTATTLHVGNGVVLWNLRRLQDMGHQAVLILGDYTASVGDPSGKDRTRPMLTPDQIEANLATWLDQLGAILDMKRVEVRRNSEWFSKMTFLEVLSLTNRMTVQQMMERDSFQTRWQAQEPISVREFLYCLMQGWDSVQVRADVELGGTDQTFNLLVGRRLMEQEGLAPQASLLSPLLEGTDGSEKMSKSLNNCIGVLDEPRQQFGMAMRISDVLLPKYFTLTTDLAEERIQALLAGDPMEAKLAMAQAMVARYHGAERGEAEKQEFLRVFRHGDLPSDLPDAPIGPPGDDGKWWIVDVIKAVGFAPSTSEARRLIQGGAVTLGDQVLADWQERLLIAAPIVLRVGKRRFARLLPPGTA